MENRIVDRKTLEKNRKAAQEAGKALTVQLVDAGVLDRGQILTVLSRVSGLPAFDLRERRISPTTAQSIPRTLAENFRLLPVSQEGGKLLVAMADSTDIGALHRVMNYTGRECQPLVAYPPDFPEAIDRAHAVKVDRIDASTPVQAPPAETGERSESRFVVATRATRYERDLTMRANLAHSIGSEPVRIKLDNFVTSRNAPMGTPESLNESRQMLEQSLLHLTSASSPSDRLRTLLSLADRLFLAEGSSLLLLSDDGQELCFAEATGDMRTS